MNLSGLVAVSGKSGLYKIIGQSKAGFILQSLEDPSGRVIVNANARLAALDETTVYGRDEDLTLRQILISMQQSDLAVPDPRADAGILRTYFTNIVPEHDQQRVYASDIKKIMSWYKLLEVLPLFTEDDPKHPAQAPSSDTSTGAAPAENDEKKSDS